MRKSCPVKETVKSSKRKTERSKGKDQKSKIPEIVQYLTSPNLVIVEVTFTCWIFFWYDSFFV